MRRIRLTESQLHRLIEQSLNELDWKTYDRAQDLSREMSDAFYGKNLKFGDYKDKTDYSAPLVRRAIIHKLSKEYGRKNVIPFINGMSDKQLKKFMSDIGGDFGKDIFERWVDFGDARDQAFAKKYGHNIAVDCEDGGATEDKEGNIWGVGRGPSIESYNGDNRAFVTTFNPNTWEYDREPYWVTAANDKKGKEHFHKLTQSEPAQDLLNNYADNYEYKKGKGWQLKQKNESIARRVTESIIRKLNESSSEKQRKAVKLVQSVLGIPFEGNKYNGRDVSEFLSLYYDEALDKMIGRLQAKQEQARGFTYGRSDY